MKKVLVLTNKNVFNLLSVNSVGKLRIISKHERKQKMENGGIADNGGLGLVWAFLSELLSSPILSSPITIMVMLFETNESGW